MRTWDDQHDQYDEHCFSSTNGKQMDNETSRWSMFARLSVISWSHWRRTGARWSLGWGNTGRLNKWHCVWWFELLIGSNKWENVMSTWSVGAKRWERILGWESWCCRNRARRHTSSFQLGTRSPWLSSHCSGPSYHRWPHPHQAASGAGLLRDHSARLSRQRWPVR